MKYLGLSRYHDRYGHIYIYKTEMYVRFFVCLSVHNVWRGGGWGADEGDEKGGQEGGGQWGVGISQMECLGGHTGTYFFPEQRQVTQLVTYCNINKIASQTITSSWKRCEIFVIVRLLESE